MWMLSIVTNIWIKFVLILDEYSFSELSLLAEETSKLHIEVKVLLTKYILCDPPLTYWGQYKMDTIYQRPFWNAFSWMNMWRFH